MSVRLPPGVTVFERGWLSSNNILCVGTDACGLVDTGYGAHAVQTESLVRRVLGDRPLDLIVNTHLHSDHCGGNAVLQMRYASVHTLIPPGQATAVASWDLDTLTYAPTGQSCPKFRFDGVLSAGSSIRLGDLCWDIHAAPGHDPHAVVLFEPDSRTLISADALWENGFGLVFPELAGEPGFGEVTQTLDVIEALAPRTVIPGHGPVFEDVQTALRVARGRLARLVNDPVRHAQHAAKVLIKFKLLELQAVPAAGLIEWGLQTPYFRTIHARFFDAESLTSWIEGVIQGLIDSHAAVRDGDQILNRE